MSIKEPPIPVNMPWFWLSVLKAPLNYRGFLNGANSLLDDLFNDILNYYYNADVTTAQARVKTKYRIVTFLYYKDYSLLSTEQQASLYDSGFLQEDPSIPGTFMCKTDLNSIAVFVDDIFNKPVFSMSQGQFNIVNSIMHINFNMFDGTFSAPSTDSTYTTSWGETLIIQSLRLISVSANIEDCPIYDNFGCLVYSKPIEDTETEVEYRNKILGLFYLMYNGATEVSYNAAANVIAGLPIFLHSHETVYEINPDGGHPNLRTTYMVNGKSEDSNGTPYKETYYYDPSLPLSTRIHIGGVYNKFESMHDIFTITDSFIDPNWADHLILPDWMYRAEHGLTYATMTQDPSEVELTRTISLSYDSALPGAWGNAVRYDTWGMTPEYDPTKPTTMVVRPITYYIWKNFFDKAVCRILVDFAYISPGQLTDMDILDSVLPIWATYLIEGKMTVSDTIDTQATNGPGYIGEAVTTTITAVPPPP